MEMGIVESLVSAVSEALKKGAGRKNMVAIVGMLLLAVMPEAPQWLCTLIVVIAVSAIVTQWVLDMYEIKRKGKDLPDNGVVDNETPA